MRVASQYTNLATHGAKKVYNITKSPLEDLKSLYYSILSLSVGEGEPVTMI